MGCIRVIRVISVISGYIRGLLKLKHFQAGTRNSES